jgi:hypothetical protein
MILYRTRQRVWPTSLDDLRNFDSLAKCSSVNEHAREILVSGKNHLKLTQWVDRLPCITLTRSCSYRNTSDGIPPLLVEVKGVQCRLRVQPDFTIIDKITNSLVAIGECDSEHRKLADKSKLYHTCAFLARLHTFLGDPKVVHAIWISRHLKVEWHYFLCNLISKVSVKQTI